MKHYLREAVGAEHLAGHLAGTRGLDGRSDEPAEDNKILGKVTDPVLQARYKAQEKQREAYKNQTKPSP